MEKILGRDKELEKMRQCVIRKTPVILHGPPGQGKTLSVYHLARELNYHVIELNASMERTKDDLEKLKDLAMARPLVDARKTILFFDEADSMRNYSILKHFFAGRDKNGKARCRDAVFVILAANDLSKIPSPVRKYFEVIKFNEINSMTLKSLLVSGGVVTDATHLANLKNMSSTSDVRQALLNVEYGGDGYDREMKDWELVTRFVGGEARDREKLINQVELRKHLIWILDNIENFFFTAEYYKVVRILMLADLTQRKDFLLLLPRGRTTNMINYPKYFDKWYRVKQQIAKK